MLMLLKEVGCKRNVIRHAIVVHGLAYYMGSRLYAKGRRIDLDLLQIGALLHDIGRSKTHTVKHGYVGAQILREKGMGERLALIIERHVGGGIDREEAAELGLPPRNYIPVSLEEKIVCYADKLVASKELISFRETLREFRRKLGSEHHSIARLERLHEEMKQLLGEEDILLKQLVLDAEMFDT